MMCTKLILIIYENLMKKWIKKLYMQWLNYQRCYMEHNRLNKKSVDYFIDWNNWKIDPLELNEYKIFTPTDLYYIKRNTYESKNK